MAALLAFLSHRKTLPLLTILIVTSLVYSNIFANRFVWDDPDFYQNWTALYSFESFDELLAGEVPAQHVGVYRPLRSIAQLFLFQLFGPTPVGYHVVSLLIHLLSTIAVYLVIEKLTDNRVVAWISALLFGLHPIHTEAISYITTSIDVIGVLLLLWSLYFYLRAAGAQKNVWFIASVVFSWLAFFTYEMTLVLPLLLLLIEWSRQNFDYRAGLGKIKLHWPYWLGAILLIIIRQSIDVGQRALTPDPATSNLPIRLMTMGKAIVKYLYLLILPFDLNVFHKINLSTTLAEPKTLLAWLAVIGLFVLTVVLIKKMQLVGVAILWFFIALLPVTNVIPTGIIMAEKYMYLASVGAVLFVAALLYRFLISSEKKAVQVAGVTLTLIFAVSYGYQTYARNFDWYSNKTLWQATLDKRPDYGRVYSNLGFSLYLEKDYDRALELFNRAKELEPALPLVYHNLGNLYDELGQYDLAIENFNQALERRDFGEFYNYAETYNNLGVVYQKTENFAAATEQYKKALEIDPGYFRAISNLGILSLAAQDFEQAKTYFETAIQINPNFALAQHGLAATLVNLGDLEAAIPHYQLSIQNDPGFIDNYNHLASLYAQSNQTIQAIETLRAGVTANPTNTNLMTNLAILLANDNQTGAALEQLNAALQIDPSFAPALKIKQQIEGQ